MPIRVSLPISMIPADLASSDRPGYSFQHSNACETAPLNKFAEET
jgi:hypothetical protein